MRVWSVTIPIAGHAFIQVEAEDEEAAISKGIGEVTIEHIDTWDALRQFNEGNFCYCPMPWVAEATDEGPVDGDVTDAG